MLLETTAQDITWYSLLALLMPLIIVVVKYVLNLDKTQKLKQKTGHQELIDDFALHAISMAEKWAANQAKAGEKPTSEAKKKMAVDFLLKQAKQNGISEKLLDSEVVSGVIEALLFNRD